jgi:crotonobetainyl-CoA:carnitine CoA-transferase CaiB-like acyl-CoA transferase
VFADAGATVFKLEPQGGDPLRRWRSGKLFDFLAASKQLVDTAPADIDVVVTNDVAHSMRSAGVLVTITPFGTTGPWVDRPATEFTLQAWAGSTGMRGFPDGLPIAVGGRLGEWMAGTYAAVGAIAALRRNEPTHVDVALLDVITVSMTMMSPIFAAMSGWNPLVSTARSIEVPSIEPTLDGYVNFTTNSAQQFADFCVMIGHAEVLEERPKMTQAMYRFNKRAEFLPLVHEYTQKRTTEEALADAALYRIPAGPVLNGETVTSFPQFVERGVFEQHDGYVAPRVPYRITPKPSTAVHWHPPATESMHNGSPEKPLEGVRVVDCTAWWAGPAAGHALACLGADVIKIESITRPDLVRYAGVKPPTVDQWWEWGPMFHGANAGKRGITLDLTRPEGIDVFESLVRTADLVIENYTPRVMEQFGLGWDRIHEINPRAVMVRMPAFGLDGPWRDHTGFAQTMESVTGMAWVTGFPDSAPVLPRGACDPLAGMHSVIATLLALGHRDATGEGCMVEATMVEAALNAAAEQVIEWSATGEVLTRLGDGGHAVALQGLFACAGDDEWIAITCIDDAQLAALHDITGDDIAAHCSSRDVRELAEELQAVGVPAGHVITPRDTVHNPQLQHRQLFEVENHPISGDNVVMGLPFLLNGEPTWGGRPSPTIGEHNIEVLTEIGLSPDAITHLEELGIIGTRPTGL